MLVFPQFGEEVHLKRLGELRRRAEREVHVLPQHLRDVRLRDLHPPRQLGLVDAERAHPPQDTPQKRGTYSVNAAHETYSPELKARSG